MRRFHIPRGFIVGKNRVRRCRSRASWRGPWSDYISYARYISSGEGGQEETAAMNLAKRFIRMYLSMSVYIHAYIHVCKKITVTIICSIDKKRARIGQDLVLYGGIFRGRVILMIITSDTRGKKRKCTAPLHLKMRRNGYGKGRVYGRIELGKWKTRSQLSGIEMIRASERSTRIIRDN